MAKLRRFNESGISEFIAYLRRLKTHSDEEVPVHILMDPSHSCPLEGGDVDIEPREFATRHEFASYLDGCLSRAGIQHEIDEEGMWEWLSLFYFDSVCPPNSSGMRIPGDEKRHILRVSGGQRPHRHLLRDPYLLHKQYCEAEAGLTDLLLCSPLAHPSDLTENISARRRIRNSPGALGAARRLFFDEKTRVAKRGTAAAEGSHKKFCVWLQNLPSHLDVSSLSSDTLIALMPPEFDKWLPHTELENLAENREMLRSSTNQNPLLERIDHASSAVSLAEVLGNFEDRVLTANQRVVRADAFRQGVLKAYGFSCAVSAIGLVHSPSHSEVSYEVDAAPIVPVARGGRDIIPNGLALNRTVHWAFDLGLIFVDREFKVNVTKPAKLEGRNEWILKFEAQELRLPENPELRPSVDALEWHRANVAVAK